MITGKIDVTKIDKARLFKGAKGTYLDIVLIPTPDDKFGNSHMIVQGISKEEREAGQRGAIIGNAKTLQRREEQPKAAPKPETADEEVPF